MSRALPFTQASLQRAIKAARKAGLQVTGIRADGTLIVNHGDNLPDSVAPLPPESDTATLSKWGDVQA
jgi:hypothetical protein